MSLKNINVLYLWIESICKQRNFFVNKLGDEARFTIDDRVCRPCVTDKAHLDHWTHSNRLSTDKTASNYAFSKPSSTLFLALFFFFSSASFLLYFYLCSNVCTGENIPGWKIIYKILAKLFEKFFRSKLLDGILKNLVTLIIPRNSRNLNFRKI